uniref:E3 ubiquitin-protein ligase n=1 Tax=Romanomermis culicivorax TaxID=13658 RepID=A0A915HDR3_ROMCU
FETVFSERASCRRRRNRHAASNSGLQDNVVNNDLTADGGTKFSIIQPDEKSGATISLTDDHKCLFYYIQQLALDNVTSSKTNTTFCLSKVEKLKTIFDQTYVMFYETESKKSDEKSQHSIDLSGSFIPETENKKNSFNDFSTTKLINTLQLLKFLRKLSPDNECSTSKKLTDKLRQQLRDVLVVAGDSLPDWCDRLMFDFPFLFPFDCRQMASSSTSSTGILRRTLEETHFFHDYRVGRIKHERVKVDRSNENDFLDWSRRVMDFHAERKSYLEVEFLDEEGTGLGPTLEFYALTAAQLQRKSLALWLCDDETPLEKHVLDKPVDLGTLNNTRI